MFAIDRPRAKSCKHATSFCAKTCYNSNLERVFPKMLKKDIVNEEEWQCISGEAVRDALDRKRNSTRRVRLMTRGEAFADLNDVGRVIDICSKNPNTLFWTPTRAWRDEGLRAVLEALSIKNLRMQASIDPSNTREEVQGLVDSGWSLMFYGFKSIEEADNTFGVKFKDCPKTSKGIKGHCKICRARCFSSDQSFVFLNQH